MNQLTTQQNAPDLIKLLKASTVAYHKAKYWEIRITYFLIAMAFAYPISYVIIHDDKVKLVLLGISFAITIFGQVFYDTFKGNTSKGAMFKEEFDVILFGLPWKSTLKKTDHKDVSKYSLQYKNGEIENWYSNNMSANIPRNIAIAVCQHSNTGWDIDLRKNYLNYLKVFIILYTILLLAFLLFNNVGGLVIFSVLFSVLSFYTHFITLTRGHRAVIEKRKSISQKLDEIILNKKEISIQELRDIQDDILSTRQEPAKVPDFFFRFYKKKMNAEFEDYIASINMIYDKT